MAFLMFMLLAIFLVIAYFTGKKDLLSPWFLLCLMIFATFIIVLLNYANWDVKINHLFILYVCTAILSFGLGGLLVNGLSSSAVNISTSENRLSVEAANIKKRYPSYLLLIISAGFTLIYCYKLLSDAIGSGLGDKIHNIYDMTVYNGYTPGFVFNQMLEVIMAIAYINTYRLMIKLFSRRDSVNIITLVLPIFFFIVTALVTSDRNIFLRYAFYFICIYVLFYRENCKKKNVNLKIIQKVIILGVIALIVFFLLGKMKQYSSSLTNALSIYGGSGLYNFNLWIKDFNEPLLHGNATFSTFLNSFKTILGYIGINIDVQTLSRFDVFIEYTSSNGYVYSSNIYSALKPFVEDFGYFGVILFPFIIGVFYQWLFLKAKKRKYGFSWVIYSMLIYPVLFFPILDQLFGRFTLGFVYELFWVSAVYYFTIGRKRKLAVRQSIKYVDGAQNAKG